MQKKAMEEHEHKQQQLQLKAQKKHPECQNLSLAQNAAPALHFHPHTHTSASRHPRTHLRTRTRAPTSAPAPAHLRTRTRTRIRRSCDTIPTLQHKPCSREHSAGATHRRPRTHARTRSPHTPRTGGGAGPSVLVCSSGWCPNGVAHQKINKNRMGGGDRREGTHAYCDMRGEGARGGEREAGGEACR